MKQAFTVVPSGSVIGASDDPDLTSITRLILNCAVRIVTDSTIGQGLILAGKIVTSLFLVRNQSMVKVVMPYGGTMQAVVVRLDERNNLAELKLVSLNRGDPLLKVPSIAINVGSGSIGAIGDTILIVDTNRIRPAVRVAGMTYSVKTCERLERDAWQVLPTLPAGLVGGGTWTLDAKLVGLSLVAKKPYFSDEEDMLLSLPIAPLMDFVESS